MQRDDQRDDGVGRGGSVRTPGKGPAPLSHPRGGGSQGRGHGWTQGRGRGRSQGRGRPLTMDLPAGTMTVAAKAETSTRDASFDLGASSSCHRRDRTHHGTRTTPPPAAPTTTRPYGPQVY